MPIFRGLDRRKNQKANMDVCFKGFAVKQLRAINRGVCFYFVLFLFLRREMIQHVF